jgi:hypothetical protein
MRIYEKSCFARLVRELVRSLISERKSARGERGAVLTPASFIRRVLGYELTEFHARWFQLQLDSRRTMILAPRGHGKSTICTVAYSLWKLLQNRDARILVVSNTADQADALLGEMKLQVETSEPLRQLFGDLRGGLWRANKLAIAGRTRIFKEASVTSTGVEGAIISRHYDVIILDDVVDEENAGSANARRKLKSWYAKVLLPCLEPGGELHVLGTRYHPHDLYAGMMDSGGEARG